MNRTRELPVIIKKEKKMDSTPEQQRYTMFVSRMLTLYMNYRQLR